MWNSRLKASVFVEGTEHGYHGITHGLYIDQLIRRVDPQHRSVQQFLDEEVAKPLGKYHLLHTLWHPNTSLYFLLFDTLIFPCFHQLSHHIECYNFVLKFLKHGCNKCFSPPITPVLLHPHPGLDIYLGLPKEEFYRCSRQKGFNPASLESLTATRYWPVVWNYLTDSQSLISRSIQNPPEWTQVFFIFQRFVINEENGKVCAKTARIMWIYINLPNLKS